jgi:galactose-1-phosphate uridylyltransferase
MTIAFRKIQKETSYLDPNRDFQLTKTEFEIRFDPLTGETGRIVSVNPAEVAPLDLEGLVNESLQIGCPFCSNTIDKTTARFPPDLVPDGRIQRGKATVIPNITPFDAYPAICLISDDHFIPLRGFTRELLSDAFTACQDFFKSVSLVNPEVDCFSINWNYMPPAGSSLIHPHLQPLAGDTPTNVQRELIRASHEYVTHYITHFWRDLVEKEEALGERYLGRTGRVVWLSPFVPLGYYPDVMAVFWDRSDLLELEEEDFSDFSVGLAKVLQVYEDLGIYGLNLSLFSGVKGDSTLWVHSRIVPRCLPRSIGNSDITYFGILHKEPVSVMKPEDLASKLRPLFTS